MLLMLDLPEPLLPIRRTFRFLVFLISGAWPEASPAEAACSRFCVSITTVSDGPEWEDEGEDGSPA